MYEPAPTPASDSPKTETAQGRYSALETFRNPYLTRAWDCAELTIPSILPRNTQTSAAELPVPWQAIGARGVNNLASKLLIAMFPPNTPFFRLMLDDMAVKQSQQQIGGPKTETLKTKLQKALGDYERAVMSDIERSGDRITLFEALKHIVVTGNACIWDSPDGYRVYHLNHYVVRRDPSGHVLEIITKEVIDPIALDDETREKIESAEKEKGKPKGKTYDLYTYVQRTDTGGWSSYQECCGHKLPESDSTFPKDKCPWIVLRFTRIDGEDYGRGYVEEHLGDLRSYEALRRAMVEGTAAASKILFLVKPNSSTSPRVLSEAPNGAVRSGNAEDVTILRLDKQADFQVAQQLQTEIKGDLAFSFLLNSAVQRDAERVTAEEVRQVAQELETTLGGFYSIMAVELQLPYVTLKISSLQKRGKLPALPKGTVAPTIVTGLEALGRGNDRAKLIGWMQDLTQTLGPEIVAQRVNVSEFIDRLATADGIDTDGLLYDDQTVQANQQAAQQQAMAHTMGPAAITAGGKLMAEGMKNGNQAAATPGTPPASGQQ